MAVLKSLYPGRVGFVRDSDILAVVNGDQWKAVIRECIHTNERGIDGTALRVHHNRSTGEYEVMMPEGFQIFPADDAFDEEHLTVVVVDGQGERHSNVPKAHRAV